MNSDVDIPICFLGLSSRCLNAVSSESATQSELWISGSDMSRRASTPFGNMGLVSVHV
jgi:hypothetical protein